VRSDARAHLVREGRRVARAVATRLLGASESADPIGEVLLFVQLYRVTGEAEWLERADAQLRRMRFLFEGARWGMYGGVVGLLFAATIASQDGTVYGAFRASLAEHVVGSIEPPLPGTSPVRADEFDLVSGWAGIALGLGALDADLAARPDVAVLRARAHDYLQSLIDRPAEARWTALSRFGEHELLAMNLGVAHGVCGIVSALCDGQPDRRRRQAVVDAADWLLRTARSRSTARGLRWPAALRERDEIPCREGWCYGTPGAALALLNAGRYAGEERFVLAARDALLGLRESGKAQLGLDDHALCHGTAGLALIADEVAEASGSESLAEFAMELSAEIIDAFDERTTFGYRAALPEGATDHPGFLEGASGIGLALLALDRSIPAPWKRALAFAPQ